MDQLGPTLMHEHVLVDLDCYWSAPADPGDLALSAVKVSEVSRATVLGSPYGRTTMLVRDNILLDDPELAVAELGHLRDSGGGTLVELTLDGFGTGPERRRDAAMLADIAARSGLNIVMGTGYYVQPSHPPEVAAESAEELAARMIRDIRTGVGNTGVRAGIIGEIGVSQPIHPDEEKVVDAAAIAALETGATVSIHTYPGALIGMTPTQQLLAAGVSPERIIVGHTDVVLDRGYLRSLLEAGVTIEFDSFGIDGWTVQQFGTFTASDAERVATLVELAADGFAGQIVLSQDFATKLFCRRYGGVGYNHVLVSVVPRLQELGMSSDEVDQMLVRNPAQLLAVADPDVSPGRG